MLRMLRRFYLNLFKDNNKEFVKRRFTQVEQSELVYASMNFTKKYFPKYEGENLSYFLVRLFGTRYKGKSSPSNLGEEQGEQVSDCIYKYSFEKFNKMHEIPEFRVVIRYIFENQVNDKNIIEDILESEKNKIEKNPEYFRKVFFDMYGK
mmetsp:Transcript_743/g.886  ORF Transcript_743/g.886 Transcript_743/m.886 type:complete len:150 (+) Transcript_743:311-760(+)